MRFPRQTSIWREIMGLVKRKFKAPMDSTAKNRRLKSSPTLTLCLENALVTERQYLHQTCACVIRGPDRTDVKIVFKHAAAGCWMRPQTVSVHCYATLALPCLRDRSPNSASYISRRAPKDVLRSCPIPEIRDRKSHHTTLVLFPATWFERISTVFSHAMGAVRDGRWAGDGSGLVRAR